MLLHYGGEPVHICDTPRCAECRKCSHCCQGCEPAEPEDEPMQETVRDHVANALQILKNAHVMCGVERLDVALRPSEYEAVIARLNAALTLLDQQESNR